MNRLSGMMFLLMLLVVIGCMGNFSYPFGAPPKGTSPNCGPEERYKYSVSINSKSDFVEFIKNHKVNEWVILENFRDQSSKEINWNQVLSVTNITYIGKRTIYSLDFNPHPDECKGFTLKMTNDGYVSVYGCCGI